MAKQHTLKAMVETVGLGLHSGEQVKMAVRPAPIDTGIIFRRVDLDPIVTIPAITKNVCDTTLCTSIQKEGYKVATIEHLMSAFSGLGIDNAYVDVDAPELPIMDGSSSPFVFLIQSAGILKQSKEKKYIKIKKCIEVRDGDKFVRLTPFDGFKMKFAIDFQHPVFDDHPQSAEIDFTDSSYVETVCRARTFGFLSDYEKLREANLVKGGSFDNAVVVDEYRILNQDGLRFDNEFVMHKVLDAVGDLYLLGSAVLGAFEGYKSGHALNNTLMIKLLASTESWEYVSFNEHVEHNKAPFVSLNAVPEFI